MKNVWIKTLPLKHDSSALLDLFKNERHVFLLDSSSAGKEAGRYSFIGFDPFIVSSLKGSNSLDRLREKFAHFKSKQRSALTPLLAGCVGLISYDFDLWFGFYDTIVTLDHQTKRIHVSSIKSLEKINSIVRAIQSFDQKVQITRRKSNRISFTSNFTKSQYLGAVRKALNYIREGDIYQVNLSQRFSYRPKFSFDPVVIYQALREKTLAPFGAYLDCGIFQLMSGSPERFLQLRGRNLKTSPMKGTRPRSSNAVKDRALRSEILNSRKEKAELLMITDLMRNDLGRVCEYGSVKVKKMRTIEKYPYVYQATSTIKGQLQKGKDAFDALKACFPAGSITGCPKIRAMQIIDELESTPRQAYTGSLGYIAFNGDMDFNVLIRTLVAQKNQLHFQVGGGIVADSIPEKEYEETLVKAQAIKETLMDVLGAPR